MYLHHGAIPSSWNKPILKMNAHYICHSNPPLYQYVTSEHINNAHSASRHIVLVLPQQTERPYTIHPLSTVCIIHANPTWAAPTPAPTYTLSLHLLLLVAFTTNQSTPSSTMTYIFLSYHYHHHKLSTHQKSDFYHQCTSHQLSEDTTPSSPQIDANINNYYLQHQYHHMHADATLATSPLWPAH